MIGIELQVPSSSLDYSLIITVVSLMFGLIIFVLYWGYRHRKASILRIFGSSYFTFGIVNPAGQLDWVNRTTADFQLVGKIILWKYKDQKYRLQENRLVWIKKIPASFYKFGNPIALDILDIKDAEIAVWDEDKATMVLVKLSAQELKGAIESKVVNELNKVGYNRMEVITLAVMMIVIILNVINLVEIISITNSFSTLINQLNTLLKQLPPITTHTI